MPEDRVKSAVSANRSVIFAGAYDADRAGFVPLRLVVGVGLRGGKSEVALATPRTWYRDQVAQRDEASAIGIIRARENNRSIR